MIPKLKGNMEQKMCGTKVRHCSEEAAKIEVMRIKKKNGDTTYPYLCPFCHYWHIGRHRVDDGE